MNEGKINAHYFGSGLPVRLRWRDGKIIRMESAPDAPPNLWVAPTLFDLQINGYGGVDFHRTEWTTDELLSAARKLYIAGCTQYFATFITNRWPVMMAQLTAMKKMRAENAELQQAIAGWHIEGPFLSDQPGFCGAHNPAYMSDPQLEQIRELRELSGSDPVLLTLAPERKGAIEAIALATSLGIKVSLGHTNASAAQLADAVKAGATLFTHLGNGCPQQLDRHDNILWRVFETRGLTAGLIPDLNHVSPALFRIIHRQLGSEQIYYTTDAVSPAGAPPGEYKVGEMTLNVGSDQIVRQPGRTNFAGSALRPIDGVMRAAKALGCPWQDVWPRFSRIPRQLMGIAGELSHASGAVTSTLVLSGGGPANFCLLQTDDAGQIIKGQTYVRGEPVEMEIRS